MKIDGLGVVEGHQGDPVLFLFSAVFLFDHILTTF